MNMHDKPGEGKWALLRAGREGISSMRALYASVHHPELVRAARDEAASVGEEFAALRELRRRRLIAEGR